MPRLQREQLQVFAAQAATGNSKVMNVADYRHIVVTVSATVNSTLTFKFKGSVLDVSQTDLTAAQAVANQWDYVSFADMQTTGTLVAGDTGVTFDNDTVVNNTRQYVINTDRLAQFAIEVTAYTDGALTAWVAAVND